MLTLYDFMGSGNGYKVRLLLAQLATPYKLVECDILKGETRTPEFLSKVNANGRIPVLQVGDRFLPESNAACWYLADGSPLIPEGRFEVARACSGLNYVVTGLALGAFGYAARGGIDIIIGWFVLMAAVDFDPDKTVVDFNSRWLAALGAKTRRVQIGTSVATPTFGAAYAAPETKIAPGPSSMTMLLSLSKSLDISE